MKRLALLLIFTLACSSGGGGSPPKPPPGGPTDYLETGGCGKVYWVPNECDPHEPGLNRNWTPRPDNDKEQLVAALKRTCQKSGADLSGYTVYGYRNPTISGGMKVNGTVRGNTIIYRCGFARVYSHEVECHKQRLGCACEDPHGEWNCG